MWSCTANLLVLRLVLHHRVSALCGVANGSSLVADHAVETRQSKGVLELWSCESVGQWMGWLLLFWEVLE